MMDEAEQHFPIQGAEGKKHLQNNPTGPNQKE